MCVEGRLTSIMFSEVYARNVFLTPYLSLEDLPENDLRVFKENCHSKEV